MVGGLVCICDKAPPRCAKEEPSCGVGGGRGRLMAVWYLACFVMLAFRRVKRMEPGDIRFSAAVACGQRQMAQRRCLVPPPLFLFSALNFRNAPISIMSLVHGSKNHHPFLLPAVFTLFCLLSVFSVFFTSRRASSSAALWTREGDRGSQTTSPAPW